MTSRIKECIRDSAYILCNKRLSANGRVALFFAYLKLSLQRFINNHFTTYTQVRFLSYTISFRSFSEFFLLVQEIFIRDQYSFRSEVKDPFIIDCGGNIGISVLYFKHCYPRARIIVFEPVPEVCLLLEQNIVQNRLRNVEVRNSALFDSEGIMPIYVRTDTSLATTMVNEWRPERQKQLLVKTETLSSRLPSSVDFLKIDVELSEQKIITNLFLSQKLRNVKEIIMEFHYLFGYAGNSLSKTVEMLEESSFDYDIFFQQRKPERYSSYLISARRM